MERSTPAVIHRNLVLFLLAGLAVVASINPPLGFLGSEFGDSAPPLWGPLQTIRSNNRWICVFLSGGLLVLTFALLRGGKGRWPAGLAALLFVHILIFAKNGYADLFGSIPLLAGFVLASSAVALVATRVATDASPVGRIWTPLVWASFGFLAVNLLQFRMGPEATMVVGGRFHGVTSNPQMYALSTAIIAPSLLFDYTRTKPTFPRWLTLLAFCVLAYFVYLSGSRLSVLLTTVSVLMFYRLRILKLAMFVVPAVIIATIWISGGEKVLLVNEPLDSRGESARILSLEDTRSHVWIALVEKIFEFPISGEPIPEGARVGFGENSYLAAGAALGLPGLIGVLVFAGWLIAQVIAMMRLEGRLGWRPELALPVAILSTSLLAGFFEAVFLGIFTFPIITVLYCAFASHALLGRFAASESPSATLRKVSALWQQPKAAAR